MTGQSYLVFKSIHIFGIIIFLGNIIVTAFWKVWADYTGDWKIISFSQRLVTYTDIIFTTTGVMIILISGLLMTQYFGDFWRVRWIAWGLSLFIASGVIWVTILIPVQILQHRLVNRTLNAKAVPAAYWRYEKIWLMFGTIATILPLINLYWMVFKPN